jgi:hypothetical protein
LIATHKHAIVVKAKANHRSSVNLLWSSERTNKAPVPLTSLYPENIRQDDTDNPYPYSPDLPEKAELPIQLSGEQTIRVASGSEYLTFPVNPDGDYSVEIKAKVLSVEGRGLDIEARTGTGNGFRFSMDTALTCWSAPVTALEPVYVSDNTSEQAWRFAVLGKKVYCFCNERYIAEKELAEWIGDMDVFGQELSQPQQDSENKVVGWAGTDDDNSGTPTHYGWACTASAPWNTANGNSGVRYMDVKSGHSLNGSLYSGRLMTVRWDDTGLYGAYYYFPVVLDANTAYHFSFLYEWWSNSPGSITAAVSSAPNISGITASEVCSPVLQNVLYEGRLNFRTSSAGTYYLMFTGGNGMMGGIGALALNKITDTPRLIAGKNYPGGSAHIQIRSVSYDENGAFAPVTKPKDDETLIKQSSGNSFPIFSRDNILYIDKIHPNTTVSVYNLTGRCFARKYIRQNSFALPLPAGIYVVVLQSGNEIRKSKVLVRH